MKVGYGKKAKAGAPSFMVHYTEQMAAKKVALDAKVKALRLKIAAVKALTAGKEGGVTAEGAAAKMMSMGKQ